MSNSRRLFLKGACVAAVGASGFTLVGAKETGEIHRNLFTSMH